MGSKEIFDSFAQRYDTEQRITVANEIADAIRLEVGDAQNSSAMDYGCGTGLVGIELIDLFGSILFVDASSNMIDQVERKIEIGGYRNAETLCSDFCLEEPPPVKMDYIFLSQVLLHVKDIPLLLGRLFSILNEGGCLIVIDFDKNPLVPSDRVHNGFTHKEITEMVEQAGLDEVGVYTFYRGENLFMKQDASLFLLKAFRR